MRRKMMKGDPGVPKSQAWGCPRHPQEIFKETQASKLGDAPASPSSSTIISSSFSTLYFYQFICYVLCLERLALYFLVCFVSVLFAVHNKLDPSLPCLGEKHATLSPRILIVFMLIFVECSLLFLAAVMLSSCFSCLSLRAFV